MNSIKAIIIGSLFVLLVMVCLQLLFVFIAVGYHSLASQFSLIDDIAIWARYLVGIPILVSTLSVGGYLTAYITDSSSYRKTGLNCALVAFLTIGGMTFSAMEFANLTITGFVVVILAILGSTGGGFYWLRINKNSAEE